MAAGIEAAIEGGGGARERQVGGQRLVTVEAQGAGGGAADGQLLCALQLVEGGLRDVERVACRASPGNVDRAAAGVGLDADLAIDGDDRTGDGERVGLELQRGVVDGELAAQRDAARARCDDAARACGGRDRDAAKGVPAGIAGHPQRAARKLQTGAAELLVARDGERAAGDDGVQIEIVATRPGKGECAGTLLQQRAAARTECAAERDVVAVGVEGELLEVVAEEERRDIRRARGGAGHVVEGGAEAEQAAAEFQPGGPDGSGPERPGRAEHELAVQQLGSAGEGIGPR